MRRTFRYSAALCAVMMMAACDSRVERRPSTPTAPVLEIAMPAPSFESFLVLDAPARAVTVGEVIEDRMTSNDPPCKLINNLWLMPCRHFLVTAPRAGTLVATVTWDPIATDMGLFIRMGDREFATQQSPWSPVTGRISVQAGQQVRVMVGLGGAGEIDLNGPFTLTTSMEQ